MQVQTLRDKTINGTVWSAADAFLGQGVTFFVGIILSRLLSPDEYGLIGICLIFNTVLNGIVDSGFSNALIRKMDCSEVDFNTMFLTNMVLSIVLYVLLFICAPSIALFFHRVELCSLIRVTGSVLIFNALSITQTTILTKRLEFKTKTKASVVSAILSGIVGIVMAYASCGVWALVGQIICKQFFYTISLWVLNRWWPSWKVSVESFKYMWGFGWKLLLGGLLNNIWNQLYQVVIGRFYSPATLGQFTKANEYSSIFSSNLTVIVQRVSYPVLSEIQGERERMVYAYRKIIKITMFITVVCMISLGAVSEPLFYTLIGDKWHEAAKFLPIICFYMSFYPLHAINLNMLQVLGRSDLFLYLEIIKKIVGLIPILIGVFFGVYSMLITSCITTFLSLYLNTWYTGVELGYTFLKQLRDIVPSYLTAFVIALTVYYIKYLPISSFYILMIQSMVGILVGFGFCELLKFDEYIELKNIIKKIFSHK